MLPGFCWVLIRAIIIVVVSFLVTSVTEGMSGLTKQIVEVPIEYDESHSEELKVLLAKQVLHEEEWLRRDELLAEKRVQREEYIKAKQFYVSHGEGFRKLRYSSLIYVIVAWVIYALLVPKNYIEYALSVVFPVLFLAAGLIHGLELFYIIVILVFGAFWKSRLVSGKVGG